MTDSDEGPPPPPSARKPTPVRKALELEEPEPPRDPPAPSRTFEDDDGGRWRVEVAGRTRTGTGADPGASLLLLVFEALEAEDGGVREGVKRREVLVPARELDDFSLDRLTELLGASSVSDFEPSEFFPGTRRDRRG